jgi:hypothetical protein
MSGLNQKEGLPREHRWPTSAGGHEAWVRLEKLKVYRVSLNSLSLSLSKSVQCKCCILSEKRVLIQWFRPPNHDSGLKNLLSSKARPGNQPCTEASMILCPRAPGVDRLLLNTRSLHSNQNWPRDYEHNWVESTPPRLGNPLPRVKPPVCHVGVRCRNDVLPSTWTQHLKPNLPAENAPMHPKSKWSMDSSHCEHRAHDPLFERPCRRRRSEVQHQSCLAILFF